jgi:hypothetical protein
MLGWFKRFFKQETDGLLVDQRTVINPPPPIEPNLDDPWFRGLRTRKTQFNPRIGEQTILSQSAFHRHGKIQLDFAPGVLKQR